MCGVSVRRTTINGSSMAELSARQLRLRDVILARRVTLVPGPIRSGKTAAALFWWLLWAAGSFSDQDFAVAVRTDRQWTNPILAEAKRWLGGTLPLTRRGTHWEFPSAVPGGKPNRLHRVIGSNVGSAEKIQGMTLAGAFVDEFVKQPREFVDVLMGRCSVPGAKIVMTCNPEGPLHWGKTDWVDQAEAKGYGLVPFRLEDNPTLDSEFLDAIRQQYTGVMARRLLDGEWAAATGLVYPMFARAVGQFPSGVRPVRWETAVDVATASVTHGLLIAVLADGSVWAVDEWRHDGNTEGQLTEEDQIRSMLRRWSGVQVSRWVIDPAANDFQLILTQMGQPTQHGYNSVLEGIQAVNLWINDGRLRIDRRCEALIREAGQYSWDEKAADRSQDVPVKGNDHGLDALRYCVNTMTRQRPAVRPFGIRRAKTEKRRVLR